jgi:ferredoxin-NADP reductase
LLIAGGVGITPLRALYQSLPAQPGDLTLVYRAGREVDVVFRDELASIAQRRGARLHIVIGHRRDLGYDPLSPVSLTRAIPGLADHDVFVCGHGGMTADVIASLRRAKVPRRSIHCESFEF